MNLNEAYFETVLGVTDPAQRDDMMTMAISGAPGDAWGHLCSARVPR